MAADATCADVTRVARAYGIPHRLLIDNRVLNGYEAHAMEPLRVEDSVLALLSFQLQVRNGSDQLAVILCRRADGRPVEVRLKIAWLRGRQDVLCLHFTDECEL